MKKTHLFTVLFAVLATALNAQNNFGKDYFCLGEYKTANKYFEQQISQSPAESNYYLGEIAFAEGKNDEAKAFFDKGIAANPLFKLNYIGQGKLQLKTNQQAAETIFATALKKNKKNTELNVAVARAYYECGMKDIATEKIEKARKYGKKSPLVYTLEGDILVAEDKPGEAAGKFEQAIYFDPNYTVASMKCAKVYESINPTLSVEMYKKVLESHPDYTIAYRGIGNSYSQNGMYQRAIEAYTLFFAEKNYNVEDITRFAFAYFFTDQFEKSITLVDEGLALEPANFVLNRLRMYNASKVNDQVNGLNYANYFFTLKSEKADFIPLDYMSYAIILTDAGEYNKALDLFNSMLEADPNKMDVYKELYSVYSKMGESGKAADSYKKYMDLMGADYLSVLDYYQLGRAYYAAASSLLNDSTEIGKTQFKEYITKADSAFTTVCNLTPDSYTGYLWRGHTNAMLDPETTEGLAKPHYEAAANAILNKAKENNGVNENQKDLVTCYQYLGYYYYLKEDKANSTKYWHMVLALDPGNANAKAVMDEYSRPAKKK